MAERPFVVDALQYSNWSEDIFRQMNAAGVAAVHVTICYHEDFRETVENITAWNRRFERFGDLIVPGRSAEDVRLAHQSGRTAVIFGFQNCSPIEDDIGLVEICHQLGARFMQLSYNNQSLLATGCYEAEDPGVTRMGRQVIREMNRVGLVIDMSHSAERSTLEAIEISERPIAITHANPAAWHPALRNKSDDVLKALAASGGMLGFSMYPHHLKNKGACALDDFCAMIARTAELTGVDNIGFGSDLCQNQPDSVVEWMRNGTWTRETDYGEGAPGAAGFPEQPAWFKDNSGFANLAAGLRGAGFSEGDVKKIMGENWLGFFERSFGPAESAPNTGREAAA
ncbi:MAG: membrane dipeptidase [Rhodospirillales bacterium]